MAEFFGTCVGNNNTGSKYQYKIVWTSQQNTTSNTSSVTATAYVRALDGSSYSTSTNWTSIINGTTVKTFSAWVGGSAGNNWVNFGSKTWTVNHEADGTAKVNITASFSGTYNSAYVLRSGSASSTVTLPTIPRASNFTLNTSNLTLGSTNVAISITRASSLFTHKVYFKYGSQNIEISSNATTSASYTPPISLVSQTPNSISGSGTIVVDTYSGNTKIGSKTQVFTTTVPSNIVPTIDSLEVSGTNKLEQYYIAGRSAITISMSAPQGVYGSTIKSKSITGLGLGTTGNSGVAGVLPAGTHKYVAKATDSRNRSASKEVSVEVQNYTAPWVRDIKAVRSNAQYQEDNNGEYLKVFFSYFIEDVAKAGLNQHQFKVSTSADNGASWRVESDWKDTQVYSSNSGSIELGSGFLTNKSYLVKVELRDSLSTVAGTINVSTSAVVLNLEKNGIGVGKFYERGALDIGGDTYVGGKMESMSIVSPKITVSDMNTSGRLWVGTSGFVVQSEAGSNLHLGCNSSSDLVFKENSIDVGKNMSIGADISLFVSGKIDFNGDGHLQFSNDDFIKYDDSYNRWMFGVDGGGKGKEFHLRIEGAKTGDTESSSVQTVITSPDQEHWLRLRNDGSATWAGKDIISTLSLFENKVIEQRSIGNSVDTLALLDEVIVDSVFLSRNGAKNSEIEEYYTIMPESLPELLRDSENGKIDFGSVIAVLWDICKKQQTLIDTILEKI